MIVVDTNVASELMRPAPDARVVAWVRAQDAGELYTTSITVAEIGYGVERLPEGARKALLRATATQVFSAFAEHVLAFDAGAAGLYGAIVTARERAGAPIDGFDAQIAAICRRMPPLSRLATSGTSSRPVLTSSTPGRGRCSSKAPLHADGVKLSDFRSQSNGIGSSRRVSATGSSCWRRWTRSTSRKASRSPTGPGCVAPSRRCEYARRTAAERSTEAQARAVDLGVVPWPIPPGLRRRDDGSVEADRQRSTLSRTRSGCAAVGPPGARRSPAASRRSQQGHRQA